MSAAKRTLPPPSTALRLLELRVVPEIESRRLIACCLVSSVAGLRVGAPPMAIPLPRAARLLADDAAPMPCAAFSIARLSGAMAGNQGRNFGRAPTSSATCWPAIE